MQQDTVQNRNTELRDSIKSGSDSAVSVKDLSHENVGSRKIITVQKPDPVNNFNTSSVCSRNIVIDFTYHKPDNAIIKTDLSLASCFPFCFMENNRHLEIEQRVSILKHLKPGENLAGRMFHEDWIVGIILISSFSYYFIITTSKNILPGISRFFLLKGINDPSSRYVDGLFHWQSTVLNLISFFITGLFAKNTLSYYELVPSGTKGIIIWLVAVAVIITAVTMRHLVCTITGSISNEKEVFREYLVTIYQSYWFGAIILFTLLVCMSYTRFLPPGIYIKIGVIVLIIMYLIRLLRLLVIFLNRNISIFYLILYLCALEILPVVISIKYFTGLV